jgi:hypothetical protein
VLEIQYICYVYKSSLCAYYVYNLRCFIKGVLSDLCLHLLVVMLV